MKKTKQEIIEAIREQHLKDLESLIAYIENVLPEDEEVSINKYEKGVLNEN